MTIDLTPPPPPTPMSGTDHPLGRYPPSVADAVDDEEEEPPPPNYQDIIEQFEPLPLLTSYGMGVFEPSVLANNSRNVDDV